MKKNMYFKTINNNKPIIITVSGGRSSAFMAFLLNEYLPKEKPRKFVFANTGKEHKKTYDFLENLKKKGGLDISFIEAKVYKEKGVGTAFTELDYKELDKKGTPFLNIVKKYGLPSKLYRHCTRELKEVPIKKYAQHYYGNDYQIAVGIRFDEPHRFPKNKKTKNIFPLIDFKITKKIVLDFWRKQDFDLEIPDYLGNCDLCFLKSEKKRIQAIQSGVNVDFWRDIEEKYSSEWQPMMDVRNKNTINDLLRKSKLEKQLSLFSDLETSCTCF